MSSFLQWAISKTTPSEKRIGFEDVLYAIRNPECYVIVNTLHSSNQNVLIQGSLLASEEEAFFNEYLTKYVERPKTIVLYGMNSCDNTVSEKRIQLLSLGISEVRVYSGGLFEWLLLQDIYGMNEFPTTAKVADLLAYRPRRTVV